MNKFSFFVFLFLFNVLSNCSNNDSCLHVNQCAICISEIKKFEQDKVNLKNRISNFLKSNNCKYTFCNISAALVGVGMAVLYLNIKKSC